MIFNYLEEKRRMLDSLGKKGDGCASVDCKKCPLHSPAVKFTHGLCRTLEIEYPEIATDTMREWAEAHPVRTRKDVLLAMFPNTKLDRNESPLVCAHTLAVTSAVILGMEVNENDILLGKLPPLPYPELIIGESEIL